MRLEDVVHHETLRARIEGKLIRAAGDGCWLWRPNSTDQHGYAQLKIATKDGRRRNMRVTRVILLLRYGEANPWEIGIHTCDTPRCCRADHIMRATQAANIADMDAKGRRRVGIGERHRSAKLTEAQVRDIRRRFGDGEHYLALSREFNISNQSLYAITAHKTWRHVH